RSVRRPRHADVIASVGIDVDALDGAGNASWQHTTNAAFAVCARRLPRTAAALRHGLTDGITNIAEADLRAFPPNQDRAALIGPLPTVVGDVKARASSARIDAGVRIVVPPERESGSDLERWLDFVEQQLRARRVTDAPPMSLLGREVPRLPGKER